MAKAKRERWLWRVWGQGFPASHTDCTHVWGEWSEISGSEAKRLAREKGSAEFNQFVPLKPVDPNAPAPKPFGYHWAIVHRASGEVVNSGFDHKPQPVGEFDCPDHLGEYVRRVTALHEGAYDHS